MKRMWNTVVLVLAANFVLVAGGVGYLRATGHLTRDKLADVRRALYPPPTTQPTETPTTRPTVEPDAAERLGDLAAAAAGRQRGDSTQAHQRQDLALVALDAQRQQLLDLQRQVEIARGQVSRDRAAVAADRAAFVADRDRAAAAAADQGFADSLAMYQKLPPKQVKAMFAGLPDDAVQRYLQAMDAKQATKVMKEFKSPADVERLERVLDRIRAAKAAGGVASADAGPAR